MQMKRKQDPGAWARAVYDPEGCGEQSYVYDREARQASIGLPSMLLYRLDGRMKAGARGEAGPRILRFRPACWSSILACWRLRAIF